jgi:DNA-binding IclR family transcriptional regulator
VENLSDFEQRVLETISSHRPGWVSFAEVCGETGLAPDIVMRILLVLAEQQLIHINGDAPPKRVEVGVGASA